MKGNAQIKVLVKIDELLNNILRRITTEKEKHVTFDETTAPPQETNVRTMIPATKPKTTVLPSITKAIVDKPIPIQTPTPRVQVDTNTEITTTPSTPRVHTKPKENILPKQMKLCHRIHKATTNQVRLPHRHNIQLHQQEQCERVQLIRDEKMGEYLNYWQLIQDPKHKKIWNTSAVNEFGRLAQGVSGRVKATNTIFFIRKDQVPKDQMKDEAYGNFSCDMKPNKAETHRT